MASVSSVSVASGVTATATGSGVTLEPAQSEYLVVVTTSGNTGNVDVILQHSPDGQNWTNKQTVATITTNGVTVVDLSGFILAWVRASITISAAATVGVQLYFRKQK